MRTLWIVMLLGLSGLGGCTSDPAPSQPSPAEVSVFLETDATEAERLALEAELRAVPGLSELTYESSEEAYERLRELYRDEPDLLEAISAADLPASYRFTLADPEAAGALVADLEQLPGVDEVVDHSARATAIPTC